MRLVHTSTHHLSTHGVSRGLYVMLSSFYFTKKKKNCRERFDGTGHGSLLYSERTITLVYQQKMSVSRPPFFENFGCISVHPRMSFIFPSFFLRFFLLNSTAWLHVGSAY